MDRVTAYLDRDAARDVLRHLAEYGEESEGEDSALDAFEACVRPTPARTIDRGAFLAMLEDIEDDERTFDQDELYQRVLALLRPDKSVVLTPQEAERAAAWFYAASTYAPPAELQHGDDVIVRRLEAAS